MGSCDSLDTTKIIELANFVRQVAPTLGLSGPQQDELVTQADELDDAATSLAPEKGRLRRLIDVILQSVAKAIPTATSKVIEGMADEAVKAITG